MQTDRTYFYVVVRTDISLADQICQVAHVCTHIGAKDVDTTTANLVLLKVSNQEELLKLAGILKEAGIYREINYEPDDDLGATAIASEAIRGDQRKIFKKYQCWSLDTKPL